MKNFEPHFQSQRAIYLNRNVLNESSHDKKTKAIKMFLSLPDYRRVEQ